MSRPIPPDTGMPEVKGPGVLRELRVHPVPVDMPVVMLATSSTGSIGP